MRKGIALLITVGMLAGMITPVSAAEQITTYKGDQEIVLTEAGDAGLTMEELIQKASETMQKSENMALFMKVDVDATINADVNGSPMSADLAVQMEMSQKKNNGIEYKAQKSKMSLMGMDTEEVSEEYVYDNAGGIKVSVKKESNSQDENAEGEWTASAVEKSEEDADAEGEEMDVNSYLSDEMFSSFELLDKMYTDGEKNYYVLKGNLSEVLNEAFSDLGSMFGGIETDKLCYMLIGESGMLESLHMDLGEVKGLVDEENGTETDISRFLVSMYTEAASEITVPDDVKAAGDAVK